MDSPDIGFQIFIILLLIVANGIFAMTEMAIVSSRKARLEHLADEGSKGAKKALKLSEDPTDLLSAVQIGITLIGIFTGAFGGTAFASYLAGPLKTITWLARYADALSLAIVVSLITYLSLILGELVPKRLALSNPERIAVLVARPMTTFVKINKPLVRLLSLSTQFVFAILGTKPSESPPVTEEEVKVLIVRGTQHGVFEETEREMVEKIFILSDLRVNSLMTPRTQVEWLDLEDTAQDNLRIMLDAKYSAFPVGRGSLDDIVGIVYTKDILSMYMSDQPIDLETLAVDPLYVPGTLAALKMLDMFKEEGAYLALVVDEFGGIDGLVTLHDVVEHIMGELRTPQEDADPDIIEREDGSWLLDGLLPIEQFKECFDLDELPGEERELYHTLAGFALSQLGHIPVATETFEWNGLRFEILDMDRSRIDKLLVSRIPQPSQAEVDGTDITLP